MRAGRHPRLTDSELLTLAVAQVLLGVHSEARWLRLVPEALPGAFPYLPGQSGYNKRLRGVLPVLKRVIRDLAAATDLWTDPVWLVDSTPLECARSRPAARRSDLAGAAGYGYCASHSRYFWGLRLHLVCTPAGLPITWALAHPKLDERQVLMAVLDHDAYLLTARPGLLLADKGYACPHFRHAVRDQNRAYWRTLYSAPLLTAGYPALFAGLPSCEAGNPFALHQEELMRFKSVDRADQCRHANVISLGEVLEGALVAIPTELEHWPVVRGVTCITGHNVDRRLAVVLPRIDVNVCHEAIELDDLDAVLLGKGVHVVTGGRAAQEGSQFRVVLDRQDARVIGLLGVGVGLLGGRVARLVGIRSCFGLSFHRFRCLARRLEGPFARHACGLGG
ncbi:transposase [Geodermatophilus sp. CPCC 205506]